jgi:hypothetical protein
MRELFKAHESEFLKFHNVIGQRRLSERPDLCAFLLLNQLCPGSADIVGDAQHDIIHLSADPDKLMATASPDDILTLVRCGVIFDTETDSLAMFT